MVGSGTRELEAESEILRAELEAIRDRLDDLLDDDEEEGVWDDEIDDEEGFD